MKEFSLYEHNQQSYDAVIDAFESGQQIASIVQATGTGKTFVAINLAKEVYPEKMLFIAPTNAIIEHVQETIREYGLEDKVNIEFITYQSLINKSREDLENYKFDYLVVDEFHHMGAPIWGARVTDLINFHVDAYVLGMSAYTIRDKGTAFAMDVAPTIIEKMTDENIDEAEEPPIFADSIVFKYDLADALIDRVLKEPKYIYSKVKLHDYLEELRIKVENSNCTKQEKEQYLKEIDSILSNLILSDETRKLLQESVKPNSKCIYFVPIGMTDGNRNIENAKAMLAEIFPDAVIYSTTSDDKFGEQNRDAFYRDVDLNNNDVSKKLRIMVAINQYNEGVHAKDVDTVILGRATQSDIVFFEQLGRALSVANSNTPLCIDLSGNLDFILSLSEEIGDRIRERYAETEVNSKLNRDLPTFTFGLDLSEINLLDRLLEIENATDNWNARFEQLKIYLDEHNNKYPSKSNKDPEIKILGTWVNNQRHLYKKGILPEDRVKKLKSINFKFETNKSWDEMFNLLVEYLNEHDNKYPSSIDKDPEIKKLGIWVANQRANYKKGSLSEDKIEKLKSINFEFEIIKSWDEMFNLLVEYLNEHNNKYPSRYDKDSKIKRLGMWVNNQRARYKKGSLSEDKIEKLESINFKLETNKSWDEMFDLLVEYLNEHNNEYPSQTNKNPEIKRLGVWTNTQRRFYKKGTLPKGKIEKLKSINFKFEPNKFWYEMFELLVKYLNEHNNKYPSSEDKDPEIKKLGIWVVRQRLSYKKGTLPKDRVEKLKSINFKFEMFVIKSWDEMFELLVKYLTEHNKYPSGRDKDPEIRKLSMWLSHQKMSFKKGNLSEDRVKRLQEIGALPSPKTDGTSFDADD